MQCWWASQDSHVGVAIDLDACRTILIYIWTNKGSAPTFYLALT